jgi:hypothetical protein
MTALGIVALIVLVAVRAVTPVSAAVDTKLAVNPSNQYPAYGQRFTIFGTLMTSDDVPIANQSVTLTTYLPGWPGDGSTVRTDARGAYVFTSLSVPFGQVGGVTVAYTVSYAGNADYNPTSRYTLVYVGYMKGCAESLAD